MAHKILTIFFLFIFSKCMVTNITPNMQTYINSTKPQTLELPQYKSTTISSYNVPQKTDDGMPIVHNQTVTNLSNSNMEIAKDKETGLITLKKKEEKIKKPHVGVIETPNLTLAPLMDSLMRLKEEMGARPKLIRGNTQYSLDNPLILGALGLGAIGILGTVLKLLFTKHK